ncbi:archease [candidate division WOR-3 bacterium]|nr:archease [candidate division WOR-3 bacterium]
MSYSFFDHTADVGIEACGKTLPDLFSDVAEALSFIMSAPVNKKPDGTLFFEIESEGVENLLLDFVSEIIFLTDSKCILPRGFKSLKIIKTEKDRYSLKSQMNFNVIIPGTELGNNIKGATYNGLSVEKKNGRYYGRIVLDV